MRRLTGIQGGPGSYHEQAAGLLCPDNELHYFDTFVALFDALRSGHTDTIVCAVSNTLIGPIKESNVELATLKGKYRKLGNTSLLICHSLLGIKGSTLLDIRYVYSQQPALDQCMKFLDTLPDVKLIAAEDTALSAKYVAEANNPANAAIASAAAGELYNLIPLATNIQDMENNRTDFIEIELIDNIRTGI